MPAAGIVSPAVAVDSDGQWYHQTLGTAQVHAQGYRGQGVTVAVIDASLTPDLPMLRGADVQIMNGGRSLCKDPATGEHLPATGEALTFSTSHGSNVVAMIVGTGQGFDGAPSVRGVAPDATVRFYAIGNPAGDLRNTAMRGGLGTAIVQAVNDGAKIISIQSGGGLDRWTRQTVAWALNQGVIIVSALSEEPGDGGAVGELNGTLGVQAVGADGRVIGEGTSRGPYPVRKVSVAAPGVDVLLQGEWKSYDWTRTEIASGTSFAAPIVAGALAVVWSAHPDATPHQLLQVLVAQATPGDPARVGHGTVNLLGMVADDPTRYPDVNPLIVADARFKEDLSAADIAAAFSPDPFDTAPPATVSPSPDSSASLPDSSGGMPGWVWVVVAAALVTGAVLTIIVILRRGGRR
ncbi:MAG: S8 family peptidase [Micrococcales bacterium]|nr:S8 family peptidase [Micrococcales bacterium]